ncbi:5'-3' exoribonuclease 3 [Bienertia sinuspersici]
MGVPAFYRWLVNKYPKVVVKAIEDKTNHPTTNGDGDDSTLPVPNPNPKGLEFDNLYLDMNGIIHPCFHPDNPMFAPTTFDQVFDNIYAYIDRIVKIEEEERTLREEFERKGKKLLPKLHTQLSDSNVITPGTEFMYQLSKALNLYIHGKLNNDPAWSQLEVIISDATVPGEGEHKIMSFIRSKRSLPGYDPNTRHCLYGLDVLIVREEAPVSESALVTSLQQAQELYDLGESSRDKLKPFADISDKNRFLLIQPQHYEFLHVWILREYLELDMQIIDPPGNFVYDVERIIDDFIFICFFIGNDFLPHMPTLEIHENAIDLLMFVYKKEFKSLGGYLVDMQRVNDQHAGYIKLKRVEKFILSVGSYEEKIFKKRADIRERKIRRVLRDLSESEADELDQEDFQGNGTDLKDHEAGIAWQNNTSSAIQEVLANTKELKDKLKDCIHKRSDLFRDGNLGRDKVKLGSVGWKQRYYKEKFLVEDPKEVESERKEIVQNYTEGLCWVLLYYFSGIPSWNWYYPYHYGPFASDLRGLAGVKVRFEKGFPFKPFDQLMAVLPPKSAHALPKAYQELMTNSNSDIIEFYPNDFEVDMDGKRFLWQGICKLPFIQQDKLLNATRQVEQIIEKDEAERNVETTDKLFVRASRSSERNYAGYLHQHTVTEDNIMCFNFELAATCIHIPRLLEGTDPPLKTIFESDIMETVLWHENYGRPPVTRYNNIAAVEFGKSKAYSINDDNNIKTAGYGGFSAGRGKGNTRSSSSTHNYVNQMQRHHESEHMQPTSACYRNENNSIGRGSIRMANLRVSASNRMV